MVEAKPTGLGAPWRPPPPAGQANDDSPEARLLPWWGEGEERADHQATMFGFHTESCVDFQNGFCDLHRPRGKTLPCFAFHFQSQRRRPPVDESLGRLRYWDVPCPNTSAENQGQCPNGDSCVFAHSQEEVTYHPAKFKTRRCNGRGCRGESICCFAHSEAEMRSTAPERYSYWALASGRGGARVGSQAPGARKQDWPGNLSVAGDAGPRPVGALRAGAAVAAVPPPPAPHGSVRYKQRFCASFPDVGQCRRGAACAFAHSREEARTPLLSPDQEKQDPKAMTEHFFMYQFKTLWCPIGVQHDWQTCVYAHNYQDARRVLSIGYGPQPCRYWAKKPGDVGSEYSQRCKLGVACPYSHGAKEQLYHPQYFRTVICRDLRSKACPRQKLCAFFHKRAERRKAPADRTNYSDKLPDKNLPADWVASFLEPPFRDAAVPASAAGAGDAGTEEEAGSSMAGAGDAGGDAASFWATAAAAYGLSNLPKPPTEEQEQALLGLAGLPGFFGADEAQQQPQQALQDPTAYYTDFLLRLSQALPPLLLQGKGDLRAPAEEPEATPRSPFGEFADESASTGRLPFEVALESRLEAITGAEASPLRRNSAVKSGAIGALSVDSTCSTRHPSGTEDDPEEPWKVKAPVYGPFSGPLGSFQGFLANVEKNLEKDTALSPWTLKTPATTRHFTL